MTNCCGCGSPTTKKNPDKNLSQPSKGASRLDKFKAALGFNAKPDSDSKKDAVRQQSNQKSCCG